MFEEMKNPEWAGPGPFAVDEKEILFCFYDCMHSQVRIQDLSQRAYTEFVYSVPTLRHAVRPANTGAIISSQKPRS
jgi:hypothetical protein